MEFQEDLKAFLDGELDPMREELIRRALAERPELQQELDQVRAIGDCLRAEPQPVPHGLEETLISLQRGRPRRSTPTWLFGLGFAGAAALAFAVFVRTASPDLSADSAVAMKSAAPVESGMLNRAVDKMADAAQAPRAAVSGATKAAPENPTKSLASPKAPKKNHSAPVGGSVNTLKKGAEAPMTSPAASIEPSLLAITPHQDNPPVELTVSSLAAAESLLAAINRDNKAVVIPEVEQAGDSAPSPKRKEVLIEVAEDDLPKLLAELKKLPVLTDEALKQQGQFDRSSSQNRNGEGFGGPGGRPNDSRNDNRNQGPSQVQNQNQSRGQASNQNQLKSEDQSREQNKALAKSNSNQYARDGAIDESKGPAKRRIKIILIEKGKE
jgi:hypothetical protein